MATSPNLGNVLKGLLALYVAAHGPESLIPHRKEPLTNDQTKGILSVTEGATIAGRKLAWSSLFFVSFAAFLTTLRHGGFRKADIIPTSPTAFANPDGRVLEAIARIPGFRAQHHDPGIKRISTGGALPTRANLTWLLHGRIHADPSSEMLAGLTLGDCAIIAPGGTKSDLDGTVFGAKPVYLPFQDSSDNAANRLSALEQAACALLMVIAKPSVSGNCSRHIFDPSLYVSFGRIGTHVGRSS